MAYSRDSRLQMDEEHRSRSCLLDNEVVASDVGGVKGSAGAANVSISPATSSPHGCSIIFIVLILLYNADENLLMHESSF